MLDSLNLKALDVPAGVRVCGDFFGGEAGDFSGAVDGPFHALAVGGDGVLVGGDGEEIEHFIEVGGGEIRGHDDVGFFRQETGDESCSALGC